MCSSDLFPSHDRGWRKISTIKDIAEKLNISTAAVSKALNDKEDVSEELKNRVKKTAEELGYSPNAFAQKLAKKRSNSIGVFVLGIEVVGEAGYFGFKFLEGIIDSANNKKYEVIMLSAKDDISYKKICEEKRVENYRDWETNRSEEHTSELQSHY